MMAMAEMGQSTSLFDKELLFGWSLQRWAFILLFIGFIIKVPSSRCTPGCPMLTSKRPRRSR